MRGRPPTKGIDGVDEYWTERERKARPKGVNVQRGRVSTGKIGNTSAVATSHNTLSWPICTVLLVRENLYVRCSQ